MRVYIDEPSDPYVAPLRVSREPVEHGYSRASYEVPDETAERWFATQDAWDDMQSDLDKLHWGQS